MSSRPRGSKRRLSISIADSNAPSKKRKTKCPFKIVRDHPNCRTIGRFEIISSDGTCFKVGLCVRFAISNNSWHSAGDRIELDEEFETAHTIEMFLELVTEKTIPMPYNLEGIWPLIQFLRKWGCEAALKNLLESLWAHAVMGKLNAKRIFLLAAHLDEQRLAKAALKNCQSLNNRAAGPRTLIDRVSNDAVVDPLLWLGSMWDRAKHLPNMDYILALSRAFRETREPKTLRRKFALYLGDRQKKYAEEVAGLGGAATQAR